MKSHLRMTLFLVVALLIPLHSYSAEELERSYNIQADFRHLDKRTFSIKMETSVVNHSKQEIPELLWMLYPNRFLQELPNLHDLNYRRIYPNGFSQGYLKVNSLIVDEKQVSQDFKPVSLPPIPDQTLYSLKLEKALKPGETRKLQFEIELKVPKKYGSFGFFRDRMTLSGGWTPYLVSYRNGTFMPADQAPKAKWEVSIISDQPFVVNSTFSQATGADGKKFVKENLGQFPIQIGNDLKSKTTTHKDFSLQTVVDERKPEKIEEPLKVVFEPWVEYVQTLPLDQSKISKKISFAQAPLREMLSVDAQDITFFSDRAYKVIQGLHQFHNVPLIRMMFSQLMFQQIFERENSRDYFWIDELVSSQLTEWFVGTQHYRYRDARNIGVIRFFSMLPLIDQIIHTPQFAFFDVFYNFVYPVDPVRDEFARFQNRTQFGRSILAHMEDELGEETVQKIIREYIKDPSRTFLQVSEAVAGKPLDDRFEHWTSPRPRVNYKIKKHRDKKTAEGFDHTVLIQKETTKSFQEPVEVKVVEKNGKEHKIIWDSKDSEEQLDFKTETKTKSIEIDPRHRLLETTLSDNRNPPYWKFVLTELFAEYDFAAGQPLILAQSQFRRKYGGYDRFNLGGFYGADSYGVNVGYTRLFGQMLDTLRLAHGLAFRYNFARLSDDGVVVDTAPPQVVNVTDDGFLTSVTTSYIFGNQISYTNPLQGGYGGLSFTYGSTWMGGNFDYYSVSFSSAKIVQLHPSHLLAFRGEFGHSGPDSMPTQVQFRLGGITSMRGMAIGDERYIGRNLLLFSGEYRHFLVQDCDINLGLFRVRDIQGAWFNDAGRVTDTVQEKADRSVIGSTTSVSSFNDLFEVQNFEVDTGYGVRFFVEYLGVSPGILRLDLAKSLTDSSQGYRAYFGVTQSF